MSLFRRGRVWWTYFYIDGVRYQISTKTTYRRQAEAVERKIIKETTARHRGLVRTDPNMPFAELAARFVATTDPPAFTLERLKELLKFFAEIPVIHINKSLVEEYRRVRRRKKKWISNATLNRDISVLRRILFWGVEEALLKSNPLSRIRMLRERRIQRQVISLREERAVLQAAPEHLRLIIIAALDTGMRRGEILTQRWEHVDLEREVLSVTRSKTPEGQAREIP
ncbi:MAG TPA: hypothetical protein VLV83_02425, partial [Acidobacteriota bacterium]|nr:hypothetical protein [Acidobacteriota bacterium]